jgi:hypothetical protein
MQARCRLGFERRVDAAISQTALEGQNAHAVIGTRCRRNGKHGYLLGRCFVEGHVRLLGIPEMMEQYGQLAGDRNNGLALGLFTASSGQMKTPLSEC